VARPRRLLASEILGQLAWVELWRRLELAARHAESAQRDRLPVWRRHEPALHLHGVGCRPQRAARRGWKYAAHGLWLCETHVGFHPPLSRRSPGWQRLPAGMWARLFVTSARQIGSGSARLARVLGTPVHARLCRGTTGARVARRGARCGRCWEADAERASDQRTLAHVERCRGLIAAANGDVREAVMRPRACGRSSRCSS